MSYITRLTPMYVGMYERNKETFAREIHSGTCRSLRQKTRVLRIFALHALRNHDRNDYQQNQNMNCHREIAILKFCATKRTERSPYACVRLALSLDNQMQITCARLHDAWQINKTSSLRRSCVCCCCSESIKAAQSFNIFSVFISFILFISFGCSSIMAVH